ncbi:DUF3556 domain-containing protein [Pseudonocardia acaciae]|uniref:DUF3556 domain-containing protein n=1 Tax=Pseudonocardia acaciae TaxID=551276 RepID=UPI00049178D6|nr:DUF3556 domain-containing protein [Pseudonocardia acaciae]
MGFLAPKLPRRFDVQLWHLNPRMERIKPLVKHWAESGFGTPWSAYLVYLAKIAGYIGGALLFIRATPGIGPLSDIAHWWTEPVVLQKAVIWTLLFEVVGFGCGFGPLTLRFLPPVGGPLYWLRPGTIRLPPFPGRVPLTRGTHRTVVDGLLYLGLLAAAVWALLSPTSVMDTGLFGPAYILDPARLIPLAVLVPLVGLRDKTIFLAARAEHTWVALLALLLPFLDMIVAVKVLTVLIWLGAAISKMNRLFPFAVSVMLSNSPLFPKPLKRRLYRRFPRDMRPSALAKTIAHGGTTVEFVAPLVLLVSTDRWLTLAAVVAMVLFHLHILASLPLGVPLEWNVFMLFSLVYLFWGYFPYQPATAAHPWFLAVLAVPVLAMVAWGNLRPDKVSFLLAMRYYAGNWATSMWSLQPSAIEKIDKNVAKWCGFAKSQLRKIYGEQVAEVLAHKVLTFRAMHHHGRGLFALLPLAAGAENDDHLVLEGELVAGGLLGWNFGEGHLHNEQLIAALQERCHFEPGEVRVVLLEARPAGSDRQEYRLVDAATGEFDRGFLMVSDLVERQPWEVADLPVYSSNPLGPPAEPEPEQRVPEATRVDAA